MVQQLIVEGKDAIAIANLCIKRNVPPPKGYELTHKFKQEFVKSSEGKGNIAKLLMLALEKSDMTNIGVVVDADTSMEKSWHELRGTLDKYFSIESLDSARQKEGYYIVEQAGMPKVGVWIMPDNERTGDIERFMGGLVEPNDPLWQFTNKTLQDLNEQPFNKVPENKMYKAIIHTYLAWQPEPGKPLGQAIEANYLTAHGQLVDRFLAWLGHTFVLNKP